jgi:hypothetical protein
MVIWFPYLLYHSQSWLRSICQRWDLFGFLASDGHGVCDFPSGMITSYLVARWKRLVTSSHRLGRVVASNSEISQVLLVVHCDWTVLIAFIDPIKFLRCRLCDFCTAMNHRGPPCRVKWWWSDCLLGILADSLLTAMSLRFLSGTCCIYCLHSLDLFHSGSWAGYACHYQESSYNS